MSAVDFIRSQIARARQDFKAAQVLADWIGSEAEPVPKNLASARAMQCINCPGRHNKFDHRRLEPAIAETIRVQESMRRHIKLETPQDGRLHSCLDTTAKYLVHDHSVFLVVWARYAGQMLIVTPWARHRAGPDQNLTQITRDCR